MSQYGNAYKIYVESVLSVLGVLNIVNDKKFYYIFILLFKLNYPI